MNKLRPSTVAMLVSAALTASVASAAPGHLHTAPSNYDYAGTSAKSSGLAASAAKEKALASRATVSGNKSHFDEKLGKATFLWAPEGYARPDMSMIAPENRNSYAASFYLNSLTGFSAGDNAVNRAELAYVHDVKSGPIVAKFRQKINGIPVFNKEYNIVMDQELGLVAGSGYLGGKVTSREYFNLVASFDSAEKAIVSAIDDLDNRKTRVKVTKTKKEGDFIYFNAKTILGKKVVGEPRARQVFYDIDGQLTAAYYVEVKLAELDSTTSQDFSYVIGKDGKLLFRKNLIAHDGHHDYNYRVFAHPDGFPMQGPHGKVLPKIDDAPDTTAIVDMPMVTVEELSRLDDKPWLPEGATITSGNNVFAYADVLPPQDFSFGDFAATITSANTFDHPYVEAEPDYSFANRNSAIVNLFYFNNWMHDWWYDFGFDEAAGNAQLDNFGRGGVGGDPLHVQAQDWSGLNNANMATPADGASPRMQQFMWNSKDAQLGVDFGVTITSHDLAITTVGQAAFGPVQFDTSGVIVRIDDGNMIDSGSTTDGCEPAVNPEALAGNIAIIDRGSCTFVTKVANAQAAGATGVIIVNSNDDGTAPGMAGDDASLVIPTLSLNFQEGQAIYALEGEVTGRLFNNYALKDSTFDNGIVAHEWGHYMQNRLIGNASGLINFQGRSMGEGWSDFNSLMFIVEEDDVNIEGNSEWGLAYPSLTYVADFATGIRRAPYTTNMEVNPLTFQHITSGATPPGLPPTSTASPHAPGEVWATTLWDVYARLLNMYEFDIAQSRMAIYLVASQKATPVAPTYTEARDALLSVMYANDMDDYNAAVEAFARRGMGFGAISPDRFSTDNVGVVESYETQLATYDVPNYSVSQPTDVCTTDGIIDAGETATVSVQVRNRGSEVLTNVPVQVSVIPEEGGTEPDVTLENGGLYTIDEIGLFDSGVANISMTLNSADTLDTLSLAVTFPEITEGDEIVEPLGFSFSSLVNYDFVKIPLSGNSATETMETFGALDTFKENVMTGGASAVGTQTFDAGLTGLFQSVNPGTNLGAQTMFLNNNAFQSDVAIETDMFEVGFGGDFVVDFWHFYRLEEAWDGGVVEISVNGSEWVDVTAVGGQFAVGYNYPALNANPTQALQDRPVFSGTNGDVFNLSFLGNEESINFGTILNGQAVKLRFRVSSDVTVSLLGWFIDNVRFSNVISPVLSEVVAGDSVACD